MSYFNNIFPKENSPMRAFYLVLNSLKDITMFEIDEEGKFKDFVTGGF